MLERISVLILAAGFSSRMGTPKMLLPAPEGSLLKQTVSRVMAAGPLHATVIAAEGGAVRQEHLAGWPVDWVETDRARLGLGASLAAGVASVADSRSPLGIMVLLGDQPRIDPEVIRSAAELFLESGAPIVQARYTDHPSHPVLFGADLFPELQVLSGDEGARGLLQKYKSRIRYAEAGYPSPDDIDTPDDYQKYVREVIHDRILNRES